MTTPSEDGGKKRPSNKLVMPEGVSSIGPVVDIQEAYVRSVMAIPELLQHVLVELHDISGSIGILALYFEKKGLAEGLIQPMDLEPEEDNNGEGAA